MLDTRTWHGPGERIPNVVASCLGHILRCLWTCLVPCRTGGPSAACLGLPAMPLQAGLTHMLRMKQEAKMVRCAWDVWGPTHHPVHSRYKVAL